ncbi:MAG TPA: anti-sigma factor [Gemmatimonadales bacterium]|nr:anti-sigma factor [Gemmatimonadales bacterium]
MSDPRADSVQDLAAAYALGALSPEERRRFEAYLATSPEAQREVAEYRETAGLLALETGGGAPDESLRGRVLERIATERERPIGAATAVRPAGRAHRTPPAVWGALAASLLAAVGLGGALVSTRGELAELRARLDATAGRLASREATLDAIFEPSVQMFQLTATGDPDPGIQLFWDRQRHRAIVHGFRLKQVPEGRAYQLWFIKDGAPVPSVTFKPEPDGHARVEQIPVPSDGTVSAAAVTVEPESGSAQPTSPILLVGPLRKS